MIKYLDIDVYPRNTRGKWVTTPGNNTKESRLFILVPREYILRQDIP